MCLEGLLILMCLTASLPPQSLLPILSGLLKMQPNLKSIILPLIPRPSSQDAIEALRQATKKLQDAYPFSNASSFSTHHSFGAPQQPPMRDDYVLSRIRPHVTEFVSTCLSYFPYFSIPTSVSVLALGMAVALAGIAALVPAYSASKLDVITALRRIG